MQFGPEPKLVRNLFFMFNPFIVCQGDFSQHSLHMVQMVLLKSGRVENGKYSVLPYQENISVIQS